MRLVLQLQPIHIWCFSWDLPGFVWNLKLRRFELAGQKAGGSSCCPNLLLFLVVMISILYSFVSRCFCWIIWNVQLSWCFWSPSVKTRLAFFKFTIGQGLRCSTCCSIFFLVITPLFFWRLLTWQSVFFNRQKNIFRVLIYLQKWKHQPFGSQVEGAREVPLCAFCNWKFTLGWDPHRTPPERHAVERRTPRPVSEADPGAREPDGEVCEVGDFLPLKWSVRGTEVKVFSRKYCRHLILLTSYAALNLIELWFKFSLLSWGTVFSWVEILLDICHGRSQFACTALIPLCRFKFARTARDKDRLVHCDEVTSSSCFGPKKGASSKLHLVSVGWGGCCWIGGGVGWLPFTLESL